MPSSLSNFWTGGEGVRGVKGGMVRGEVQGSVLVGNTGVGFRKSEGGTRVEEERVDTRFSGCNLRCIVKVPREEVRSVLYGSSSLGPLTVQGGPTELYSGN